MHDVICVGGGIAGAATAARLAREGRRVLVLDRAHFPREKACGEGIMPYGMAALERLGFEPPAGMPVRGLVFRTGDARLELPFPGRAGLAVRRLALDAALLRHAASSGAEVLRAAVRGVGPGRVTTDRGAFTAKALVGADGVHSVFHRDFAVPVRRDGSRVGFSTHLAGLEALRDRVEILVFAGGELYVAAVEEDVVLTALLVERRLGLRAEGVPAFLRSVLGARFRRARLVSPVLGAAPLATRVARSTGPGWLLVGDSAGRIDPASGQGMSMALVTAEYAATAIGRFLDHGEPLAAYSRMETAARRPAERLTRLLLGAARRPRVAGLLAGRSERLAPLIRTAAEGEPLRMGALAASVAGLR